MKYHEALLQAQQNGNGEKALEFIREYFPQWYEMYMSLDDEPTDPRALAAYVAIVTYMHYGEQESEQKKPAPRVYLPDDRTPINDMEVGSILFVDDDICEVIDEAIPGYGKLAKTVFKNWRSYFHNEASQIGAWVRALYAMGRVNDDEPALAYEDVL